jgi:hypothetical protein
MTARDTVTLVVAALACAGGAVLLYQFLLTMWIRAFRQPSYLRSMCVVLGVVAFFVSLSMVFRMELSKYLPFDPTLDTVVILVLWAIVVVTVVIAFLNASKNSIEH